MDFDNIIDKSSPEQKDSLIKQALKKQEYNRNYQRKLRQAAKLATLEKRVDDNLDHVLGYIKTRYDNEYKAWRAPVVTVKLSHPAFDNWVLLSADNYKSINDAYELSGLSNELTLKQFTKLFKQNYKENNSGGWDKH